VRERRGAGGGARKGAAAGLCRAGLAGTQHVQAASLTAGTASTRGVRKRSRSHVRQQAVSRGDSITEGRDGGGMARRRSTGDGDAQTLGPSASSSTLSSSLTDGRHARTTDATVSQEFC